MKYTKNLFNQNKKRKELENKSIYIKFFAKTHNHRNRRKQTHKE